MSLGVTAHISLEALSGNLELVRSLASSSRVVAVIKSDAYGHGLIPTAEALKSVEAFGISRIDEAIKLRKEGVIIPILLLEGIVDEEELQLASQHNLDIVLHSHYQLRLIEAGIKDLAASILNIWLKVDTGMNRLGFAGQDVPGIRDRLASIPKVQLRVVMSHLANADVLEDPATDLQIRAFSEITQDWPVERSLANSGGLTAWPESQFDWVRPGIMLYGISPFVGSLNTLAAEQQELLQRMKPAMTLKSRLISVKKVSQGEAVGYGGQWVCSQDSIIGVVGVGYGYGYPRQAPTGTPVLINNARYAIVGRVSMGMLCVDLTSPMDPAGHPHHTPNSGDEVILWGQGLPIEEVAESIGVIPYELVTGVTGRVEFQYG